MPWISPGPKYPPILFGSPPPLVGGSLPPLIVTPYPPPDLLPESIIIWGVLLGSYIASPWRASTSAQGRRPGGSPAIFKPGAPIWVHSCPLFHLGPIILCCYWLLPVVVDNIYDLLFCYHHLCQLYLDDLHPPPTPPPPPPFLWWWWDPECNTDKWPHQIHPYNSGHLSQQFILPLLSRSRRIRGALCPCFRRLRSLSNS